MKISSISLTALIIIATLITTGCSTNPTTPNTSATDVKEALTNITIGVIIPTYKDMLDRAQILDSIVSQFKSSKTEDNLNAAKQAWRDARRPWEQSEGFLFGPVETKGIDPRIDSWPLNKIDLDGVLASSSPLTKETIDQLESTQKGFHTIEYLLFGANNSKTAKDFTIREIDYLVATTQSFKAAVFELWKSWDTSGDNFGANFINAGVTGSSIYVSQHAAVQEIIQGMINICDEVANGKINEPFTLQDRQREESQFSDNSNADFADNIRSVRNVYHGVYGSFSGKGISFLVAEKNAELDARCKREIDAAIETIGAMLPSFGQAIFTNKANVRAAQDAVLKLKTTLNADVIPLLIGN
ncbi:MAG: hypothetical protein JST20_10995 [Bacteroidetes bacterium]|nr:hypothetical protein [Bacteroidota bacterium]